MKKDKLLDLLEQVKKRKLVNVLKECNYNANACRIAIDADVLKLRTVEEQIRLMNALKECNYNDYAC